MNMMTILETETKHTSPWVKHFHSMKTDCFEFDFIRKRLGESITRRGNLRSIRLGSSSSCLVLHFLGKQMPLGIGLDLLL